MSMGNLITATALRRAALDTLQANLWDYLQAVRDVALEPGELLRDQVVEPRTWERPPDIDALPVDQTPAIAVTSTGLSEAAERDGEGVHRAPWALHVFVVLRGNAVGEISDLVGIYTAAIRACLAQVGLDVEGARKPRWRGEEYAEWRTKDGDARQMGAGVVTFELAVGDVLDDTGKLTDDPTATVSSVTVASVSIQEPGP